MQNENSRMVLDLEKCRLLYDSGIFHGSSKSKTDIFRESAFIALVIKLNHILQYLDCEKKRISFKEDLIIDEDISDITDLVNWFRNAACHINSRNRNIKKNRLNIFI
jgi:hypothetical protein